jgi:zinc D-Ala-D-Ala carboxypeptidase
MRSSKTSLAQGFKRQSIHASGVSIGLNASSRLICERGQWLIHNERKSCTIRFKRQDRSLHQAICRLISSPIKSSAAQLDVQLRALALPRNYGQTQKLNPVANAPNLVLLERDRFGRRLWLHPEAAAALAGMRAHALRAGVELEVISAFRSQAYQSQLIARKRARGQSTEQILQASAAPGYSEHHSGCAVDFVDANSEPLTASFADGSSFKWLTASAHRFGFFMSYPENNLHGVLYEPWHWCYRLKNNSTQLRKQALSARRARKSVVHFVRTLAKQG